MTITEPSRPPLTVTRLALAAGSGLVAGLVASAVMNGTQRFIQPPSSDDDDGDPANVVAADRVSEVITGKPIEEKHKDAAGEAVHYALGAALGIGYALAAEIEPRVTAGGGTVFGAAAALVLDEALVPALGLGAAPTETDARTHLYGLVSHLIFGAALEGTRRGLRVLA